MSGHPVNHHFVAGRYVLLDSVGAAIAFVHARSQAALTSSIRTYRAIQAIPEGDCESRLVEIAMTRQNIADLTPIKPADHRNRERSIEREGLMNALDELDAADREILIATVASRKGRSTHVSLSRIAQETGLSFASLKIRGNRLLAEFRARFSG